MLVKWGLSGYLQIYSLVTIRWHMTHIFFVLKKVISHLFWNKPFTRCEMYVQLDYQPLYQMFCNCMSIYLAIPYEGHVPSYSGWTIVHAKQTFWACLLSGYVIWYKRFCNKNSNIICSLMYFLPLKIVWNDTNLLFLFLMCVCLVPIIFCFVFIPSLWLYNKSHIIIIFIQKEQLSIKKMYYCREVYKVHWRNNAVDLKWTGIPSSCHIRFITLLFQ